MMTRSEALARFRTLHQKKGSTGLDDDETMKYRACVERLLELALARQEAETRGGQRRRAVRIPRAVAVDLQWSTRRTRSFTLDLSTGGFSVLLGAPPPDAEPAVALLHVRRGRTVTAAVRVVSAATARGRVRVSMAFIDIPVVEAARLRDYLVEELFPAPRVPAVAVSSPQQHDWRERVLGRVSERAR